MERFYFFAQTPPPQATARLVTVLVSRMQKSGTAWGQQFFQMGRDNREIKIHVYRKRQTSDSSWEFLRIENKQIKTVPNDSYG